MVLFLQRIRGYLKKKKPLHPPFATQSCLLFFSSLRAGGLISKRIWCLCCHPMKCIWVDPPVCGWLIEFHTWGHRFLGGAWEWSRRLLFHLGVWPPPGNKGERGGDGRGISVWVGAGWQGTSGSVFEQAAARKTTDNRGQVERGERQSRYVLQCAAFSDQKCHCVLFLFLSPSFAVFFPQSL